MYNKTEQLYKNTPEKKPAMMSSQVLRGQKVMHWMPCRSPLGSGSAVKWRVKVELNIGVKLSRNKEGWQNNVEKNKKRNVNKRKSYERIERDNRTKRSLEKTLTVPGSDSSMSMSGPLLILAESSDWTLREFNRPRSCSISLSLLSRAICSSTRTWDSSANCCRK